MCSYLYGRPLVALLSTAGTYVDFQTHITTPIFFCSHSIMKLCLSLNMVDSSCTLAVLGNAHFFVLFKICRLSQYCRISNSSFVLWIVGTLQLPETQKYVFQKDQPIFKYFYNSLFNTQRTALMFLSRRTKNSIQHQLLQNTWSLSNRSRIMHHPFKFYSLYLYTLELERSLTYENTVWEINDCFICCIMLFSLKPKQLTFFHKTLC